MARTTRPLLFSIALALGVGGGVAALLQLEGRRGVTEVASPGPDMPRATERVEQPETLLPPPQPIRYDDSELLATTVLWPLRVELDLVEASYLPRDDSMVPIGSGSSAALAGHILGADEKGLRATVRFVAGPNAGRVLSTDVTGKFGATDLFPGLSIVEVSGPGILGSRREVRLRQGKELPLNISYGAPGPVSGHVQDEQGEPIEGANVSVDGIRVSTGIDGEFFVSHVAAGQVLVEVDHPDFASYQELVHVAGAFLRNRKDGLTFTLRKGCTLRVALTSNVGGPGPVRLLLLPGQATRRPIEEAYRNMRYPYHRLNPVEVWPGAPTEIHGLPAEVLQVHAFRSGAEAKLSVVNLRVGQPYDLKLHLSPAPVLHGVVTQDGEPVEGARVVLEAPDAVRATLAYLRQGSYFLETAVMPVFPPARQETLTDERGRYVLSAYEAESATRYLEARGPDGASWAGRLVRSGEEKVDLALSEVSFGDSELVLDMPERWQGLPLEVLIDGAPLDPWILPPNEDFRLENLIGGRWGLRVSWHGVEIAQATLELDGATTYAIELPEECIEGQDAETWSRAGREYPADAGV